MANNVTRDSIGKRFATISFSQKNVWQEKPLETSNNDDSQGWIANISACYQIHHIWSSNLPVPLIFHWMDAVECGLLANAIEYVMVIRFVLWIHYAVRIRHFPGHNFFYDAILLSFLRSWYGSPNMRAQRFFTFITVDNERYEYIIKYQINALINLWL